MGKKRIKKTNTQTNNNNHNNENIINNNIINNDEEDEDKELIEIKIDLKNLIDIINSSNTSEIYKLTSFLSNYNYDILCQEEDKRGKEIFALTSNDFLLPYLNIYLRNDLNDENNKMIKYNIISSIINIFSAFSENSKYNINFKYIYHKILSEIFYQSFITYIKENSTNNLNSIKDNTKNKKTIMIIFDLFQLFIDIIKNDEKNNSSKGLINYDLIIGVLIKDYVFNNFNNIDNDIRNKAEFLLFSLISNFYIEINDKNNVKILLNNILNNSINSNNDSFLYFISFYLSACQKDIKSLEISLEKINCLTKDIEIFNKDLNDLLKFLNENFELEGKKIINENNINSINLNISDDEIQKKLNSFLLNCKTVYGLIKIYSDIIENINDSTEESVSYPDDIFLNNMTVSLNKLFNIRLIIQIKPFINVIMIIIYLY